MIEDIVEALVNELDRSEDVVLAFKAGLAKAYEQGFETLEELRRAMENYQ